MRVWLGSDSGLLVKILVFLVIVATSSCRSTASIGDLPRPRHDQRGDTVKDGDSKAKKEVEGCQISSDAARLSLHRLNAAEFDNTVRDILATTSSFSEGFPVEGHAGGFDNSAEALVTSATMAEKFWSAAGALSTLAVEKFLSGCLGSLDPSCLVSPLDQLGVAVYRRPLFPDEKSRLVRLPASLVAQGATLSEALNGTAMALFMSPQFLFRAELTGDEIPNASQYAIAERLSYFLWSSKPDDTLLSLAKEGRLSDPEIVKGQILRMLGDRRADAFVENFAGQWLGTRQMVKTAQDNQADVGLAQAFEKETLAFFGEFVRKNRNIRRLLDAKFTYANAQLSSHYGLKGGGTGGELQRVELGDSEERGGILTQGSFLAQTSNPTTTSPVKRGKWIMENLLCSPPEPPPSDEAATFEKLDPNLSIRDRLAKHRENPACAGCHAVMDPLGLGFENYDALGKWRTSDRGHPIDASGSLPEGASFASPSELGRILQADSRYSTCFTQKLSTYALGREPTAEEMCVVHKLAEKSGSDAYGLRDLLVDLSLAFLVP
jgi:hypothetical protein